MTNLEKIRNVDVYDMLVKINKNIMVLSHYENCVLETLEERHVECICGDCKKCIREYLNSEVKTNEKTHKNKQSNSGDKPPRR